MNSAAIISDAKARIDSVEAKGSTKAGWLMVGALLIESWDIYALAFILVTLKEIYHPDPWLLGLAGAGTQLGAMVGALLGGWLTDKFGRRRIFLISMIMFAVFAILQGLAPDMWWLAVIRVFAGLPVGSDVANGFAYMMEVLPKGKREVMANRWQFMFAIGTVAAVVMVTLLSLLNVPGDLLWRIVLMFPALLALILLLMRAELPETAAWLLERGKFKAAKKVGQENYGGLLNDLPDEDVVVRQPGFRESIKDLWSTSFTRKATIFGWVSCTVQAFEFAAFAFYLPMILAGLGIASRLENNLVTIAVNCVAAASAWIGPLLLRKIGHRGLSQRGFALVVVGLVVAAVGVMTSNTWMVGIGSAVMLWGHYWDAESGMTVVSVVAKPAYRGAASGVGYMLVKATAFVTTLVFPTLFQQLGVPTAALLIAIGPAIAFFVTTFVLPEVFGHGAEKREVEELDGVAH